ncbi:MAG: beta-propeller domain-containing protein [Treponema sp.]|nr:beta-propeller domain-containing protein [Treponema sp.]
MLADVNSNEYKTAIKPSDSDILLMGKITSIETYDTSDRKNIKRLGEVIQK